MSEPCEKCKKEIVKRSIHNSANFKRWDYWNKLKELLSEVETVTDVTVKDKLLEEVKTILRNEYTRDVDFIKSHQQELKDIDIKAVPEEVMDFLKDALNNYVLGKYKSAMIIAGAAAEHLLLDIILQTDLSNGKKQELADERRGQNDRLLLCIYAGIIDNGEYSNFENIRKARNECVHAKIGVPKKLETELRNDAREVLRALINLVNKTYQ